MLEITLQEELAMYLTLAKPLILNLPDEFERVMAARWVVALASTTSTVTSAIGLARDYARLLLVVLPRRRLLPPFLHPPPPLPSYLSLPPRPSAMCGNGGGAGGGVLEACRSETDVWCGGSGRGSARVAVQRVGGGRGVHCYLALSVSPALLPPEVAAGDAAARAESGKIKSKWVLPPLPPLPPPPPPLEALAPDERERIATILEEAKSQSEKCPLSPPAPPRVSLSLQSSMLSSLTPVPSSPPKRLSPPPPRTRSSPQSVPPQPSPPARSSSPAGSSSPSPPTTFSPLGEPSPSRESWSRRGHSMASEVSSPDPNQWPAESVNGNATFQSSNSNIEAISRQSSGVLSCLDDSTWRLDAEEPPSFAQSETANTSFRSPRSPLSPQQQQRSQLEEWLSPPPLTQFDAGQFDATNGSLDFIDEYPSFRISEDDLIENVTPYYFNLSSISAPTPHEQLKRARESFRHLTEAMTSDNESESNADEDNFRPSPPEIGSGIRSTASLNVRTPSPKQKPATLTFMERDLLSPIEFVAQGEQPHDYLSSPLKDIQKLTGPLVPPPASPSGSLEFPSLVSPLSIRIHRFVPPSFVPIENIFAESFEFMDASDELDIESKRNRGVDTLGTTISLQNSSLGMFEDVADGLHGFRISAAGAIANPIRRFKNIQTMKDRFNKNSPGSIDRHTVRHVTFDGHDSAHNISKQADDSLLWNQFMPSYLSSSGSADLSRFVDDKQHSGVNALFDESIPFSETSSIENKINPIDEKAEYPGGYHSATQMSSRFVLGTPPFNSSGIESTTPIRFNESSHLSPNVHFRLTTPKIYDKLLIEESCPYGESQLENSSMKYSNTFHDQSLVKNKEFTDRSNLIDSLNENVPQKNYELGPLMTNGPFGGNLLSDISGGLVDLIIQDDESDKYNPGDKHTDFTAKNSTFSLHFPTEREVDLITPLTFTDISSSMATPSHYIQHTVYSPRGRGIESVSPPNFPEESSIASIPNIFYSQPRQELDSGTPTIFTDISPIVTTPPRKLQSPRTRGISSISPPNFAEVSSVNSTPQQLHSLTGQGLDSITPLTLIDTSSSMATPWQQIYSPRLRGNNSVTPSTFPEASSIASAQKKFHSHPGRGLDSVTPISFADISSVVTTPPRYVHPPRRSEISSISPPNFADISSVDSTSQQLHPPLGQEYILATPTQHPNSPWRVLDSVTPPTLVDISSVGVSPQLLYSPTRQKLGSITPQRLLFSRRGKGLNSVTPPSFANVSTKASMPQIFYRQPERGLDSITPINVANTTSTGTTPSRQSSSQKKRGIDSISPPNFADVSSVIMTPQSIQSLPGQHLDSITPLNLDDVSLTLMTPIQRIYSPRRALESVTPPTFFDVPSIASRPQFRHSPTGPGLESITPLTFIDVSSPAVTPHQGFVVPRERGLNSVTPPTFADAASMTSTRQMFNAQPGQDLESVSPITFADISSIVPTLPRQIYSPRRKEINRTSPPNLTNVSLVDPLQKQSQLSSGRRLDSITPLSLVDASSKVGSPPQRMYSPSRAVVSATPPTYLDVSSRATTPTFTHSSTGQGIDSITPLAFTDISSTVVTPQRQLNLSRRKGLDSITPPSFADVSSGASPSQRMDTPLSQEFDSVSLINLADMSSIIHPQTHQMYSPNRRFHLFDRSQVTDSSILASAPQLVHTPSGRGVDEVTPISFADISSTMGTPLQRVHTPRRILDSITPPTFADASSSTMTSSHDFYSEIRWHGHDSAPQSAFADNLLLPPQLGTRLIASTPLYVLPPVNEIIEPARSPLSQRSRGESFFSSRSERSRINENSIPQLKHIKDISHYIGWPSYSESYDLNSNEPSLLPDSALEDLYQFVEIKPSPVLNHYPKQNIITLPNSGRGAASGQNVTGNTRSEISRQHALKEQVCEAGGEWSSASPQDIDSISRITFADESSVAPTPPQHQIQTGPGLDSITRLSLSDISTSTPFRLCTPRRGLDSVIPPRYANDSTSTSIRGYNSAERWREIDVKTPPTFGDVSSSMTDTPWSLHDRSFDFNSIEPSLLPDSALEDLYQFVDIQRSPIRIQRSFTPRLEYSDVISHGAEWPRSEPSSDVNSIEPSLVPEFAVEDLYQFVDTQGFPRQLILSSPSPSQFINHGDQPSDQNYVQIASPTHGIRSNIMHNRSGTVRNELDRQLIDAERASTPQACGEFGVCSTASPGGLESISQISFADNTSVASTPRQHHTPSGQGLDSITRLSLTDVSSLAAQTPLQLFTPREGLDSVSPPRFADSSSSTMGSSPWIVGSPRRWRRGLDAVTPPTFADESSSTLETPQRLESSQPSPHGRGRSRRSPPRA